MLSLLSVQDYLVYSMLSLPSVQDYLVYSMLSLPSVQERKRQHGVYKIILN
jgi:hypothetical protein